MTASELIEKLQEAIREVGDVDVLWMDDQECHDHIVSVTPDDTHKLILLR
jgi:hypothetical protein